jgi:hypothetical protein
MSSLLLPRHMGGPMFHYAEGDPPAPAAAPPVPPPAPPPPAYVPPPAPSHPGRGETIEDVRAEAAARRIDARNAREAAEAAQREVVRIQKEADERVAASTAREQGVTTKIKARTADAELRAQAQAAGLQDMDLLPLINRSGIVVDDEGNVTGVAEAIEALKVKKPVYFTAPAAAPPPPRVTGSGAAPPPPPAGAAPPAPTNVRQMSKEDYDAQKRAALRALK